ncbi:MAG: hypothetical protein ABF429_05180 [Zymomonas mobilis]|uniref:hypothetical protein n=1 Tax=Zymomonas mobilis TaxID=542 RepID=UPI000B39FB53|nr:hypothetical protein [Zymomonas mobilis]ART93570.1 hypothetical protein B9T50_05245 [Zymomonas mobilis subsp. mobilis]TWD60283.1 hypothetical protein FBY50_1100 [Zymomonas mobilis]
MPLSNITYWPSINLTLYKGNTASTQKTDNAASNTTSQNQENSVQISDKAKSISDTENAQPSLKSRINALFKEARDEGSFITFDSSKGGEWIDFSSFTDDELAQIGKDRNHDFSEALSKHAIATLAERVTISLEPFEATIEYGDFRGDAKAIRTLYSHMSQDVRDVLGWTENMVEAAEKLAEKNTEKSDDFNMDALWEMLMEAAKKGGILLPKKNILSTSAASFEDLNTQQ